MTTLEQLASVEPQPQPRGAASAPEDRQKRAQYKRQYRKANPDKALAAGRKANADAKAKRPATFILTRRKYQAKIRGEILEFFGGRCVLCGFADRRALQLDHINGDGAELKRTEGSQSTSSQYTLIRNEPDLARSRYRLLCANCNQIKKYENMECRYTKLESAQDLT